MNSKRLVELEEFVPFAIKTIECQNYSSYKQRMEQPKRNNACPNYLQLGYNCNKRKRVSLHTKYKGSAKVINPIISGKVQSLLQNLSDFIICRNNLFKCLRWKSLG